MGPPSNQQNIRKTKETLNLNGLQRYDPTITRIIDQTSHVVIYYYDTQANRWEKEGVEGALFFYQRSVAPYYGFTVMNRVGLDNFSALFRSTLEIQLTTDFIIFRDVRGTNTGNKEEKEEEEECTVSSNDQGMLSEDGEGCTQYVCTESGQVVPVATRKSNKGKLARGQESRGKTKRPTKVGTQAATERPVIHGIWIYDAKDRTRIGQIMNQLRMACMTPPSSATGKPGSSTVAPLTKRTKPKGTVKKGRDLEESTTREPKVAAARAPVSTAGGQVEASKIFWKMLESARGTTPEPQRNLAPQPISPSRSNRIGRGPAEVAQLKHNLLNQLQGLTVTAPSASTESQPSKLTSPTRKYSTSSSVASLPTSPQADRSSYGLGNGAVSVGPYPPAPLSPTHSAFSVDSPRTNLRGPVSPSSQSLVDHSVGASNSQKLLALLKQGPAVLPSNAGQPAQVVAPPTTVSTQSSLLSILTGKPIPTGFTQDQRPAPTPPPPSMLPVPHFPLLPGPVPPMHMMSAMGYPMPLPPMVPHTYEGNWDPHAIHALNAAIPMHVAQQQQQQSSSQGEDTKVNLLSREDFQIQMLHALQHDSALVDHLYREYCALVQHRQGNYGLVAPFFPSMVPHVANPHHAGPPLPPATYVGMNGGTSMAAAPIHLTPTERVSSSPHVS